LGSLATRNSVSPSDGITGLGGLATKDTVAAGTDVTGLGGLATKSTVTNAELAANAVQEGNIALGAITSGKIAANAVIAEKIGAGEIIAGKIATNAVTAGTIAAGAVTADKITVTELSALGATIGGWSIDSNSIFKGTKGADDTYTSTGGSITIGSGWISSKNFKINSSGDAAFRGNITATGGSFTGNVTAGGVTIGTSGINVTGTYGITVNALLGLSIEGDRSIRGYTNFREFENGREANTGANIGEQINTLFTWYTRNQNAGEGAICGIAASTGNLSFYGNGGVRAYRFTQDGGGYQTGSDRRLKDNINKLNDKFGIEFINKLNPVEFVYKREPQYKKFGFIAQEVSSSLLGYDMNMGNSTIVQCDENTKDKTLTIDYTEFIIPLVKSVQQLSAKVEELEAKLSGSI